ncbi:Syntaxin-8 [Cyberlindnera fabianii]|uniref:Syntaxin-8 n=1 Tax=Cyberlindnera fabianii TaxID=36022 RepID=A0A1V2L7T6_CYBFA|nr:Syntaxin-8 [Cyberlindnera fabianii]
MSRLSSLRLLESYLEDFSSVIEESNRLHEMEVSSEDSDYEVRKSLQKITKFLERNDDGEDFDELVDEYTRLQKSIKTLDPSEYEYNRSPNVTKNQSKNEALSSKKSVRFNDTLEFSQDDVTPPFKPYRDDVVDDADDAATAALFEGRTTQEENDAASIDSSSNTELFIQHQQTLVQQDDHLDSLARSVRRQHGLATDIHGELEDQNILLDDLENQLDSSDRRLSKGQRRLHKFERMAKENSQWLTIIALIIILVLLLVVLN